MSIDNSDYYEITTFIALKTMYMIKYQRLSPPGSMLSSDFYNNPPIT